MARAAVQHSLDGVGEGEERRVSAPFFFVAR
jgi:hypothetical protein